MSGYHRVCPRDLFNESALLKDYGRLALLLMDRPGCRATLSEGDGSAFRIEQDPGSGGITIANLPFAIGGKPYRLHRPLNTRAPWSFYATDDQDEETSVFTDDGSLSAEFLELIGAAQ